MKLFSYIFCFIILILFTGCNQKQNQFTIVQEANKNGVVNQSGYVVVKPIYKQVLRFDGTDNFVTHPNFLNLHWLHNKSNYAYAIVQGVNNQYGVINQKGELLLKPIYDSITYFFDIAIVKSNGKYGCINRDMEIKVKPTYNKIYLQQEEFLRTTLDNKWGYLDNQCNTLAKPIFDYAYDFSNGIAKIVLYNKVGYLNNKGKLLSKPIFKDDSSSF